MSEASCVLLGRGGSVSESLGRFLFASSNDGTDSLCGRSDLAAGSSQYPESTRVGSSSPALRLPVVLPSRLSAAGYAGPLPLLRSPTTTSERDAQGIIS